MNQCQVVLGVAVVPADQSGVFSHDTPTREPGIRGHTGSVRNRLIAAIVLLGVITACAADPVTPAIEERTATSSPASATTATIQSAPESSPSARPSEQGQKVIAAESDFGTILFDDTGQAIYLFDIETTSQPRCYGPCADSWPPLLSDGAPVAGHRVKQALLATTERTDGTTQVTYDGHPLYLYAHEGKDEVKCHDVFLNGGTWYAVQPDGRRAP